jgi:hypothetical protein
LYLELQRALSKRPYERHRSAEEMAAALRNAVDVDETSLDAFRRSDLPSPSRLEDAQKPGPSNASAQTSEEHLLPVPRRAPSKRIVLAASVAVCAAIGTLVAVQLATRKPAASEMIAPREIVREASATPAAQASAPVIAPSTTGLRDRPPPTARPIARPAPSPSSQPPRVKAIATTPGF